MTSVFELLSFPKTSDGLTKLQSTSATAVVDEGSGSPARKVARLAAGSDSASASRSKPKSSSLHDSKKPIQIQVIGSYKGKPPVGEKHLAILRRSIRILCSVKPDYRCQEPLPTTYEGIFNACQSVVVVCGLGDELYNILKIEVDQSVNNMARLLSESKEDPIEWIALFNDLFNWFEEQIDFLTSFLTYLDQVYVIQTKNVLKVRDLVYSVINDKIFGSARIASRLFEGTKTWILEERQTHTVHRKRSVIPSLVSHLLRHHQYTAFEKRYVDLTQSFYREESAEKAEALKDDPKVFFEQARACINEEAARVKAVLPVSAWGIVRTATETALWGGRVQWLSNTILSGYMEAQDFATLGDLYSLFSRVDGIQMMCNAFATYLRTTVAIIVSDETQDDNMVQRLLDFKELADKTVTTSFLTEAGTASTQQEASTSKLAEKQPDQKFVYAVTDAFATGFKARRSKPAEMIAKYVDKAMRKGQGKSTDAEFQALLDKVLVLYRFTDDKDVFRTFYHRSLARRLLLEKSASDDFEKAVLKKLKENYDPEFGMGEEMFKDLALSRESISEYHLKLPEDSPGWKLNAMVLKRSAWPFTAQKKTIDLPPSMQEELTKYTEYYKAAHTGYVLDWDHSLGTATLKARFNEGTKELSVSMYQTIVLLLFNEATQIPFPDIKEQTGMDDAEVRRVLQSLACGKKKVLKKIPPGKDVKDTDLFRFNADFQDPHAKIHINSIQVKVSPEESKRTNESIEDERKHYLDAAIVRVMKARKEMTYEQLKTATIDAVKGHFVPQVDTIKRRIDSLVEMEYLERSQEDRNKYKYVA